MRRRFGVVLLLLASACGAADDSTLPAPEPIPAVDQASPTTLPVVPVPAVAPMPPLRVRGAGVETTAHVYGSCWSSGSASTCGTGRPPETPPDAGGAAELEVAFDTPGWRFTATAVPTGDACHGRAQTVDLQATGPTTHRLVPIGKAGDYTITLHGRSTPGATNPGDVAGVVRWRTPRDGPNEAPSATVSFLAARPGDKLSFPAELSARALGVSTLHGKVEARVVVTASSGASTVDFHPDAQVECVPEGSMFYRSHEAAGSELAALGPPPYRYDVTLVLGTRSYRGAGAWPDDVIEACSPCTRLRFTPPLPAL